MKTNRLMIAVGVLAFTLAGLFTINSGLGKSRPPTTQGKWVVASVGDAEQFKNPAVPVVVVRVTSGLSDPDEKANKQYLVKEVIVENRSNKKVSEVTIRWALTPMNNRLSVLSRGELTTHRLKQLDKQLLTGQRQTLKLSHPKIRTLIDAIPNLARMGNEFTLVMGVGEVVFEDGTTWKEGSTDVVNKSTPNQ